jgi:hypothetical protein
MKSQFRFLIVMLLIVSLTTGCATRRTGESTSGRTIGTVVGATAGGLIGGSKHGAGGAIAGAVIGGLAGYTVGWAIDDYKARKTKTAEQVKEQYAGSTPGSAAPNKVVAHAYRVTVAPSYAIKRGESVVIVTTFDLIVPEGAPVNVEEERTILKPDGSQLATRRDVYNKDIDGSGGYEFSNRVGVPKGIDQGYFSVASTLYIDGKNAGSKNSTFQVVKRGKTRLIAKR